MDRKIKNKQVVWVNKYMNGITSWNENLNIVGNPTEVILLSLSYKADTPIVANLKMYRIRADFINERANQLLSFGDSNLDMNFEVKYKINNLSSQSNFFIERNNAGLFEPFSIPASYISFVLEFIEYCPCEIPKIEMKDLDIDSPAPSTNTANNDLQIIKII